jgi:AcrR family transcriptional regulator
MSQDIAGRGDPLISLQLLWGKTKPQKRGPKAKGSVRELVKAAVAIADAEGIEAVSTRRVADAVGISSMSFYTHIPSKAELLDLMLDEVMGTDRELPASWKKRPWRERLTWVAEGLWRFYLEHPWVLQLATHRPALGPNTLAAYEMALSAVDGLGLDEIEMDLTITSVSNYVMGAVRDAARARMVKELTGISDEEWWHRIAPFLETVDFTPYPVSSRVGPIVGAAYGVGDPERAFKFGLQRILDGLEILIASKAPKASKTSKSSKKRTH